MNHTFRLHVNCGNAAFCSQEADYPTQESAALELARILRAVAARIESGDTYYKCVTIRDVNGNDAGQFSLKPEQE